MNDNTLWWRDGVIYQIYPRSFADSNGDGLGDLQGICSKLDYLADLGVQAIWLSPIYPTPDADFGYDISDYTNIDPRFGTLEDFDHLVAEAHQRGIRIIMDLVFNHTSDQHPWFKASRSSRDNPYRDWYIWRPPRADGKMPNNWQSVFGGPGWEYDSQTGEYYFHMFVKQQPDLNWRNPAVRQAILDVVRFWLERGTDGFRLDVFNAYFKHKDLPDNPPALGIRGFDRQKHIYDIDQPELVDFLAELRALVDSYPERYMVGETFVGGADVAAGYIGPDKLHAAFNFSFTHSPWKPRRFFKAIDAWEKLLGPQKWPNYVFNNHDLVRSATRYTSLFAGNKEDDARMKVAAALLLTLRGTPFLYYGEEIGMRDLSLRRSEIMDPPGKKFWPFYKGRDGCRGPMQWDTTPSGGFTNGKPWLKVHPDHLTRNVTTQRADPNSLLNFYRSLLKLRRATDAFQSGEFHPQPQKSAQVMTYTRSTATQTVVVALNLSGQPQQVNLSFANPGVDAAWQVLLSTHHPVGEKLHTHTLDLEGYEVCILEPGGK